MQSNIEPENYQKVNYLALVNWFESIKKSYNIEINYTKNMDVLVNVLLYEIIHVHLKISEEQVYTLLQLSKYNKFHQESYQECFVILANVFIQVNLFPFEMVNVIRDETKNLIEAQKIFEYIEDNKSRYVPTFHQKLEEQTKKVEKLLRECESSVKNIIKYLNLVPIIDQYLKLLAIEDKILQTNIDKRANIIYKTGLLKQLLKYFEKEVDIKNCLSEAEKTGVLIKQNYECNHWEKEFLDSLAPPPKSISSRLFGGFKSEKNYPTNLNKSFKFL